MKKLRKHVPLLFALIFAMFFSTVSVEAKTTTLTTQTATLYSNKDTKYDNRSNKYISKNESVGYFVDESIYPKTIKSSKTSIAVPGRKISNKYSITYAYVKVKKVGSTVISGKDGDTVKYKLNVKKYANPFASLTLNESNLTSRFKTRSVYTLSYAKYKNKRLKLNFKEKSGWSVSCQSFVAGGTIATTIENNNYVKVNKKGYTLRFHAYNKKIGQYETCEVIWK